jgi:hypothetical protein
MSKSFEVKSKGLTVKVFVSTIQRGKPYQYYQVAEYSTGKRKLRSFSDEGEARQKALDICEATASGQPDLVPILYSVGRFKTPWSPARKRL